jgi:farnesyl-diphosphate farnesyltransferase
MNSGNVIGDLTSGGLGDTEELAYQARALSQVSRTFALTIPQLPMPLAGVVGNAYLLCRIADTIEDAPELAARDKQQFAAQFVDVVAGRASTKSFGAELSALLTGGTPDVERDLVANTPRVVAMTHGFSCVERDALTRCVRIMSEGMAEFQEAGSRAGLADMAEMDRYCYVVAGVVGEMLTALFCEHCPSLKARQEHLLNLAVDFGQALQMTNILKDMWEDRERGACWLPADVFARYGVSLSELKGPGEPGFQQGLDELLGIARGHLERAVEYTLMLPSDERGIRKFCLWALGMAILTLRKIASTPGFGCGQDVKISRRAVRMTVISTSLCVSADPVLRWGFSRLAGPLPAVPASYQRAVVSRWTDDAA